MTVFRGVREASLSWNDPDRSRASGAESRPLRRNVVHQPANLHLYGGCLRNDHMLSRSVVRETICRIERGFALVAIGLLLMAAPGMDAWAQSLPQPSRTVFRCEVEGKVTYSDSPCLGARRIQIEPTRGVSKLSGRERIGNDVRVERHREIMAEALQPLTGMDAKKMQLFGRRLKLEPTERQECFDLDGDLATLEQRESTSSGSQLQSVQGSLLKLRIRYRELGC